MSLLTPDAGLLFWMLLSFGAVFFLLAKYGFPVIVKMVEERRAYIQQSLDAAKAANDKIEELKRESDAIIASARAEQTKILHEAHTFRDSIINSAKEEAGKLTSKLIDDAKKEIEQEREKSMKMIRNQVAELSVNIAGKVIRKELEGNDAHMDLIEKYIKETTSIKS
ncbi:MAG: F0F1 ATP synthase subunit B [Bacteroidales bacterium]|nr:F0F1 ATP synthase subunit B [Bacteroidales bacterium]